MNCKRCGKPLTGKQEKWCSDRCKLDAFNAIMPIRQRYREVRGCIVCGKEFETFRHGSTATCSRKCAKQYSAELSFIVVRS